MLIKSRYGFFDEALQKICRKEISALNFIDTDSKMRILFQIYEIVIKEDRPLYFSLLLDFVEKNRKDTQLQLFLIQNGEEMSKVLDAVNFDTNHNIRYINSIVLMEATDNQLKDRPMYILIDQL